MMSEALTSLFLFAAVFIRSDDVLISPFRICLTHEHAEMHCTPFSGAVFEVKIILCLYVPLVLVAFSLLAMLFAAYTQDRALLWCSVLCQAGSSLLIMTGIIVFLLLNLPFVAWENMTLWFYIYVGVQVELVITTLMTSLTSTPSAVPVVNLPNNTMELR
ncbi:unnamed protein product [Pleuronectes platessa]|uniref:Uncharacterized protein n=1 Tax=Pleuronectes platessa TaxID=8262 RepID=A0A9N7UWY6_PLEPL|nr:unnamed protein product [Pleuronectes platessa]